MSVLVTGATGFVGEAVSRRLLADGEQVRILVRGAPALAGRTRAGELCAAGAEAVTGALDDPNPIAAAAAECDAVIHCASEGSAQRSPEVLGWINVAGTENVLQAAKHAGCRTFIHLSCADVTMVNRPRVHWREEQPMLGQPLDAHARTKLLAEELALSSSRPDFRVTALRPALLWGPGDTHLLPQLCAEARKGRPPLFGDGTNLVSTTYIDNLVTAVICALACEVAEARAYYITDEEFIEAREFFGMLCESAGLPPPRPGLYALSYAAACTREWLGLEGPRRGEVIRRGRSYLFDTGRATADLGYRPTVSLQAGMDRVRRWAQELGGPDRVAERLRRPATKAA